MGPGIELPPGVRTAQLGAAAGSRRAPGGCGNPDPRARAGWPVPPGLGRGVMRLWLSGPMGNQVGKGWNMKPCRWRGPSPGDGTGWGRGARGGRRTGRGQEGKVLAKASAAESESADVAQANAGRDPPASPTWNLGIAKTFKRHSRFRMTGKEPSLARTRSADGSPKPPEGPPHCLGLTTSRKGSHSP